MLSVKRGNFYIGLKFELESKWNNFIFNTKTKVIFNGCVAIK